MPIEKLNYSHETMIDLMIANPRVTVRELALRFGYTEGWIYQVKSSDAFKEKLRERTQQMVDPVLTSQIEERFDAMVNRSLEVLMDKLAKPSDEVDPGIALQAAALGAKARGYGGFGAKVAPAPTPRPEGWLEQQAARIRSLNNQGVIDVQAVEVKPEAGQARTS